MNALPIFLETTAIDHLRRLNSGLKGGGRSLELNINVRGDEYNTYLDLRTKDEDASLVIPNLRRNKFNNLVIGDRNARAVCPFMVIIDGRPQHVSYEEMVSVLFTCNIEDLFPEQGKRNFLDKILYGFIKGGGRLAANLCQRFLNLNLFNALPLSGTPMQDWAMNRRLMIFDPVFDSLRPAEKLEYQKRKNELLFPWSSLGLSDGAAATKNYILQADLRKYTAFGIRHHNPIRNLYSTLGMKGEESAFVISESALELEKQGVERKGWNWMTVFLDLPDNFEDQILVSKRHAGKTVTYERSITIHGEETVLEGDTVIKGKILGVNEDESPVVFDVYCDHAKVTGCKDGEVPFDGKSQPVRIVMLEVTYSFREGVKITNQHGNKGVVRLTDLGTVDIAGTDTPIDVIVSAKSIQKRKNFGQVLEALASVVCSGADRIVVPDDYETTLELVGKSLVAAGLPVDGAFVATTPWGTFSTLAGVVHWGVIKTPEEQLWEGRDVWAENQRGLRTRGNKISPIELKALTTLFGPQSQVVNEILSYQQGVSEVTDSIQILECIRGNYKDNVPTVNPNSFVYVPAGSGTFHDEQQLVGTVADKEMYPQGCYITLPFTLSIQVPLERRKGSIVECIAGKNAYEGEGMRTMEMNRIMVPPMALRMPWRHPTGMMGISEVSTLLNQILEAIDRLGFGEIKEEQVASLIFKYLRTIGRSLSMKTGKISQYLMSVRYPWSSKATAVLGSNLEENHVEIHEDMAKDLKVNAGDCIIVERFPCLGFMSTRIQRVQITNDPECKYVIRVSGNSLVSMNLDFDGDVIYLMSFHTESAKEELVRNFVSPHPKVQEVLRKMNNRKVPITRTMNLNELEIKSFPAMSPKEHAELNATSLAVKLWTGPVIALCYNLMRIVEGNISYEDRESHINVEVFLDMVGNSVFSQKHGIKSLREECTEAVCLADADALIKLGFPSRETHQLCNIIREYAVKVGVRNDDALAEHYRRHVEEGYSNIINTIVRRFHKAYFATRSSLHPIDLLEHLEDEPKDLVGHLINMSLKREAPKRLSA